MTFCSSTFREDSTSATMSTRCRVQAVGTLKYKRQRTHNGLEKCPARCAWRCARAISRRPTCWSGNGSANNVYHREGSSRTAGGVRFCPPLREQGSLHWRTFRCAIQLRQLRRIGNTLNVYEYKKPGIWTRDIKDIYQVLKRYSTEVQYITTWTHKRRSPF